ncbi:Hypothetical protein CINCED_3A016058 [Cinara cedri]|uniref:Small GTP-binding protein domain,P-loop containing nucleoside triphosphate hydrolase,Small GTPase n=1 Tax=Cinara cedri TaxID=506608 RepID=A0A5E4MP43_9HEMI|nr:Hypothetical protein CINCED_3A016058 [Cinara cedri]
MSKRNEIRPVTGTQISRKMLSFKIVLLGEYSVGKSSLVNRLVKDQFNKIPSTIGAAYCTFTIQINNTPVKLEIWDTAGQERFHGLVPMYYRHAQAAIVVYDVTNRVTFEKAKKWIKELQNQVPSTLTMLVGNKLDLNICRSVEFDELQKFADENNLLFMETSAKHSVNVTDVFKTIARKLSKIETANADDGRSQHLLVGSENDDKRNCCM